MNSSNAIIYRKEDFAYIGVSFLSIQAGQLLLYHLFKYANLLSLSVSGTKGMQQLVVVGIFNSGGISVANY